MEWPLGSNSRARSSGLRPARTRSTICRRNSGEYGGRVLGIGSTSGERLRVSTKPGQSHPSITGRWSLLDRADWLAWLDLTRPEAELLRPLPDGSLAVEQVR